MREESALVVIALLGVIPFVLAFTDYPRANNHDTLLIYPTFTEQAYQKNGWYDNPEIKTVSLSTPLDDRMKYGAGQHVYYQIHTEMDITNDIVVSRNPDMLKSYDTVVLLHNEYITVSEYNAIMNHSNVIYIFPNSLYRYVEFDDNDTMTLINETGNPMSLSKTQYTDEFSNCLGHSRVEYSNGKGLSCYPRWFEMQFNPFLREDIRRMIFDD